MLKKITIITAMVFIISFLGFAITLPIGIKTVFGDIDRLLETSSITPEKIQIPNNIETLDIDFRNYYYHYNHVLIKQSPDDTAYIEIFDKDTYQSMQDTITINYVDDTTAKINYEAIYGKFKFNKDVFNKSLVMKLQNYPNAILYIPTRMNIITDYPDYFDNIYFNNKQELLQQQQSEEEEERILQKAEELLEKKYQEEEMILQRAEEIKEERLQREDIEY
ncbi:hypothetical protein AAK894_06300 [Lachnospiraceae bacterium 46-61]